MPKSLNKVLLMGNIGKDPEIKSTSGGILVANFSLATTNHYKDANGNWIDESVWHSLVAFSRTAEIVRDYLKKGDPVLVEGRIQTRSWEKDGQKHYKTEIVVNELFLLGGKSEKRTNPAPTAKEMGFPTENDISDDDIPF